MDPFDPTNPSSSHQAGAQPAAGWAMPDSGSGSAEPPVWAAPEPTVDDAGDDGGGDSTPGPPRLPAPLRPMTVSDLLDGGFAILKSRPGAVFGACAVIVVPFQLLQAFLSRNVVNSTNINFLFSTDPTTGLQGQQASDGDVALAYLGQILATMSVLFVGCVLARMVSAWYAGGDVSTGDALKGVLKAAPVIVATWFIVLIPNALALAAGCIGWFFLNPLFMVVAPVIMIEGLGPFAAIKRSTQLVGRRYLWVVLYNLCVTVMAYLASNALTLVPQILGVALPQPWNWIALGAGQTVVAIIITPAVAGVAVLLYLDLRIRSEGLDIELKAADAFASAA